MPKFEKHIFVCTNQRDKDHPRGSCDPHGDHELQKKFKKVLAEVVVESLAPLQKRYKELTADPSYIPSVLKVGAGKARPVAEKTLKEVQNKIGLG